LWICRAAFTAVWTLLRSKGRAGFMTLNMVQKIMPAMTIMPIVMTRRAPGVRPKMFSVTPVLTR
jgi:hypothetical protein